MELAVHHLDPLGQLGDLDGFVEYSLAHGAEDPAVKILEGDPGDDLLLAGDVEQVGDPGLSVLQDFMEMGLLDDILDMLAHGLVGVDADETLAETAHEADDALLVDDDGALVGVVDQGIDDVVAQPLELPDLFFFCHDVRPRVKTGRGLYHIAEHYPAS